MKQLKYIVTEATAGERLDKTLANEYPSFSRQQLQGWIKTAFVKVNGNNAKPKYLCKIDDVIELAIPTPKIEKIEPEKMDIAIIYEDEYLIVINKPKGLLVHPTHTVKSGTLVNGLMYHAEKLSTIGGEERPGIVHRLDQDTSGVLVVAKDNDTHEFLKEQFKNQTAIRKYEAIVFGQIQHETGIIRAPIGRNPENRLKMAVVENGKPAETHFTVIQHFDQYTHVLCELKTGRTHQIRVHMKYMNHPIVGDQIYARKKSKISSGQALFARQLIFVHPKTKEFMTFEIERPAYFDNILLKLDK